VVAKHRPGVLLVTHDVDEAIVLADRHRGDARGVIVRDFPVGAAGAAAISRADCFVRSRVGAGNRLTRETSDVPPLPAYRSPEARHSCLESTFFSTRPAAPFYRAAPAVSRSAGGDARRRANRARPDTVRLDVAHHVAVRHRQGTRRVLRSDWRRTGVKVEWIGPFPNPRAVDQAWRAAAPISASAAAPPSVWGDSSALAPGVALFGDSLRAARHHREDDSSIKSVKDWSADGRHQPFRSSANYVRGGRVGRSSASAATRSTSSS